MNLWSTARQVRLFAMFVAVLFTAAACTAEEPQTEPSASPSGPSETADASADPTPEPTERPPVTLEVISAGFATPALEEYVVPYMLENYNVTVVMTPQLSSEALATAIAQRANPTISVVFMDTGPWEQGKAQGLWGEIDPEIVTNLADIPEEFTDPDMQGVGYASNVLGFIVNTERLEAAGVEPPTSYLDLKNPEYQGHLTMQQFTSTYSYVALWQLQRILGADLDDPTMDAAFQEMAEITPNIRALHGSTASLIDLFLQDQDVWVAHSGSNVPQRLKSEGEPYDWIEPEEGAAIIPVSVAPVANAPNYEEAMLFINVVLSPEFGAVFAEFAGAIHANPASFDFLSDEFAEEFFLSQEVVDRGHIVPFDLLNENRVPLNDRYQREVEAQVGS